MICLSPNKSRGGAASMHLGIESTRPGVQCSSESAERFAGGEARHVLYRPSLMMNFQADFHELL
jgi:hypothetical protein